MSSVVDSTNIAYAPDKATAAADAAAGVAAANRAARSTAAAVEVEGLSQRLGRRWALRAVALRVEPGETVAVVGPNGSGKTTLLRVMATVLTPTRGSGTVFGLDLLRDADAVRESVGMLGQATGLYDDLTVGENLAFALRMYGLLPSRPVIADALESVGMSSHANEIVRVLSSGMRRRVALARLLLRRARLLLLDEPYNTFDAAGIALVDALIRDTVRSGGAALVVTHDPARTADGRYDRVVGLSAGRLTDAIAGRGRLDS